MIKLKYFLGVVVVLLAAAGPQTVIVRRDLTLPELDADGDTCLREAKEAERNGPRASLTGGFVGALAGGMAKGQSDMERFFAAHNACIERLGYDEAPLDPEQAKQFRKAKGKDRQQFIVDFSKAYFQKIDAANAGQ